MTAVLRAHPLPAPRILVIDDNRLVAQAVRRMFGTWGVTIEVETDPRRAVERIRGGSSLDLIVCDLEMPLMSGHEVLATIRAHFGTRADRPNVILMSGSDELLHAADTGDAVLMKPFNVGELRALVRQMIGEHVP